MSGPSVCKIIRINPGFRFGLSKNKNIDHLIKETYAIMSTQVTCETSHIPTRDSAMSNALNFCFFQIFVFHCNLAEEY